MSDLAVEPVAADEKTARSARSGLARLSFRNVGAVYVWLAIIVLFGVLSPDSFLTADTARTVLNNYSVTGLVALSLVIPMAAGLFDASVGNMVGLAGIFSAYAVATWDLGGGTAILLTLVLCALCGLFNGFVVVVLRVHSLIGTLATGSLFLALTLAISKEQSITQNVGRLRSVLAGHYVLTVTIPVIVFLALTVVLTVVMDRTTVGRSWYALGFDAEVGRLVGLRVRSLQMTALVIAAVISGVAGMLLTARIGSASPAVGPSYLLPAFAAVFLGATQFRGGRFNAPGTAVAVLMIGTGTIGLSLAGAPTWSSQVFQGVVLIAAIALSSFGRRG
ncbi:ABC transporter permease [Nocardioides soli]|uniref:Ribose transport system permease protein n=1 Tax=Nocardioides soli TaxID=1036020 RepID=A0A7W4W2C9_9ACTN|nr:ABC transporter permease [Nocardioides soli]MBB3045657.1 ribose transport system permease protein [Nocardioides soli]